MSSVLIDLRHSDDTRDAVHRAVQALSEGQLVAFPTETVYGLAASALHVEAVQRLLEVKGRAVGQPLTLAVRSSDDALDYVPDLNPLGRRLARRCWPGPLTLILKNCHPDSLLYQLPRSVQQATVPGETIGLRVPAHPVILDVLRLMAGPLVLSSANRKGDPESVTAQEIVETLGDDVPLVLDDGRSQFGQPSSVVKIDDRGIELLREGVVSAANLKRLASFAVIIICTGNTCRSPMAEALCRHRLAEKLGCSIAELEDQGVIVQSAGIAAMMGGRAAPEAVACMRDRGLDLDSHETQPLTDRVVRQADVILAMTQGHRDAVLMQWPEAGERVELICTNGNEVADPIGGPAELYNRCAAQIDQALAERIAGWDLKRLIGLATGDNGNSDESKNEGL